MIDAMQYGQLRLGNFRREVRPTSSARRLHDGTAASSSAFGAKYGESWGKVYKRKRGVVLLVAPATQKYPRHR